MQLEDITMICLMDNKEYGGLIKCLSSIIKIETL